MTRKKHLIKSEVARTGPSFLAGALGVNIAKKHEKTINSLPKKERRVYKAILLSYVTPGRAKNKKTQILKRIASTAIAGTLSAGSHKMLARIAEQENATKIKDVQKVDENAIGKLQQQIDNKPFVKDPEERSEIDAEIIKEISKLKRGITARKMHHGSLTTLSGPGHLGAVLAADAILSKKSGKKTKFSKYVTIPFEKVTGSPGRYMADLAGERNKGQKDIASLLSSAVMMGTVGGPLLHDIHQKALKKYVGGK